MEQDRYMFVDVPCLYDNGVVTVTLHPDSFKPTYSGQQMYAVFDLLCTTTPEHFRPVTPSTFRIDRPMTVGEVKVVYELEYPRKADRIEIRNAQGKLLSDKDTVKTGCTLTPYCGYEMKTLRIVIG